MRHEVGAAEREQREQHRGAERTDRLGGVAIGRQERRELVETAFSEREPDHDQSEQHPDLEHCQHILSLAADPDTQVVHGRQDADQSGGHHPLAPRSRRHEASNHLTRVHRCHRRHDRDRAGRVGEAHHPPEEERGRGSGEGAFEKGVGAAGLRNRRRQLGEAERAAHGEQARQHPGHQEQTGRPHLSRNIGRHEEDARADDAADDQGDRLEPPEAAVEGGHG